MGSYRRGSIPGGLFVALLAVLLVATTPAVASVVLFHGTLAEYAASDFAIKTPLPNCGAVAPPPVTEEPVVVAVFPLLYNTASYHDLYWEPSTCYAYAYVGIRWIPVACW